MKTRRRLVSGLSIACSLLVGAASARAHSLSLDRQIYDWGDTIYARVAVSGVYTSYSLILIPAADDEPTYEAWRGETVWSWSVGRSGFDARTVEIDSRLWLPGGGGKRADPYRGYYTLLLEVHESGGTPRVAVERRLFIRRRQGLTSSRGFRLTSPGRVAGLRRMVVGVDDPRTIYTENDGLADVRFLRLGRYLPGGAVVPDHMERRAERIVANTGEYDFEPKGIALGDRRAYLTYLGDDRERLAEWGFPTEGPPPPEELFPERSLPGLEWGRSAKPLGSPLTLGYYEARVIDRGGAILGRFPFEVGLPDLSESLRVSPAQDVPYSLESPPTLEVDLPPDLDSQVFDYLNLWVYRIGRNGSLEVSQEGPGHLLNVGALGQRITVPLRRLQRRGLYEARLSYDAAANDVSYRVARVFFEIGGEPSPADLWRPLEPLLEIEEVDIEIEGDFRVRGSNLRFTVTGPDGLPLEPVPLTAQLYFTGHYTYDCLWREGRFVGPVALLDDRGRGEVYAPLEPGAYELRVYRPLIYGNYPAESLRPVIHRPKDVGSFPQGELIGVETIEVVAPAAPGAIRGVGGVIDGHAALPVSVSLSGPQASHHHELQLWMAADRFPNGLVRAPMIDVRQRGFEMVFESTEQPSVQVEGLPFATTIEPLRVPGDYELRLLDRTTGYYIDRARFSVRDPGPPALPADARYHPDAITDWPTVDDPRRGIEAWRRPKDACEDPVFPEPPELRLVELVDGEPHLPGDEEYRPVPFAYAGYPYFVEARFAEAPADEVYRVRVDDERRIRVFRTEDPRVYRSEILTFAPEEP